MAGEHSLRSRSCPDHGEILDWLHRLRAPVRVAYRVAYEAGPTGSGLARALAGAEIDCVVAAPSKLIRPAGDRVETDARDAAHLSRLSKLLLCQGLVYSGGHAWTGVHETWLRRQRFEDTHTTAAFDHHIGPVGDRGQGSSRRSDRHGRGLTATV